MALPSLLERMACAPYGDDGFAEAVSRLEPSLRDALLGGDMARLVAAVDGQLTMACMILAPDQESPEPSERPLDDEPVVPDSDETPGL